MLKIIHQKSKYNVTCSWLLMKYPLVTLIQLLQHSPAKKDESNLVKIKTTYYTLIANNC